MRNYSKKSCGMGFKRVEMRTYKNLYEIHFQIPTMKPIDG